MSKALYLSDEFRPLGKERDGSVVFSSDVALRLIDESEKRRIRIFGIDSYRILETFWDCLIDEQANYSRDEIVSDENWDLSRSFIRSRADRGYYFDIVLGDAIEYQKAEPDR